MQEYIDNLWRASGPCLAGKRDKGLTKQTWLEVHMATINATRDFRSLLSDLAALEPRHGFQLASDVCLDASQVATVLEHEPDTMLDALADVLPLIAYQMRGTAPSAAAISSTVINALSAAAQRVMVRELACYCDDERNNEADDRAYEAGMARVRASGGVRATI